MASDVVQLDLITDLYILQQRFVTQPAVNSAIGTTFDADGFFGGIIPMTSAMIVPSCVIVPPGLLPSCARCTG